MSIDVVYLRFKNGRKKKIEMIRFDRGSYKRFMLPENQLILKKIYYIYHWNRFQEKNKAKKLKLLQMM